MSLSPFDSFQSRFVTYLLYFPRNKKLKNLCSTHGIVTKSYFEHIMNFHCSFY